MSEAIATVFPNLTDAHSAKRRLERAGFARNSVEIDRVGEGEFAVSISVRPENHKRALKALNKTGLTNELKTMAGHNVALTVGLAALAGAGLFWLAKRDD